MSNVGILDPYGENVNPLTDNKYSQEHIDLMKNITQLPAYKMINKIIQAFQDNQVVLTLFGTGTGKTVIVPPSLLHSLRYKGKIMVSLPKKLITKSAATFMAKVLDVQLGQQVGYKYKGSEKSANSEQTQLLYASDGTIVQKLLKDPLLTQYDAVIIDELHEHKIQIDMLLYLLRETLKSRPEFKLILMSATVDVEIFSQYFKDFKFTHIKLEVPRQYEVESIFLNKTLDYDATIQEATKIANQLLKEGKPQDIIIFVTSSNDAFKLCQTFTNNSKVTCSNGIYCVEVYSGMNAEKEQYAQDKNAYKTLGPCTRKIVIGTNVMESSLTIDGIKFVIDTGYEFKSSFDPINAARRLDRILISQAQAKQRMGRVGRTEPGICYHLYSKHDFEHKMIKFPEPDIQLSDITNECLQLLNAPNINNTTNLVNMFTKFVAVPLETHITYAITTLSLLGAVENNVITELGSLLTNVPINDIFMAVSFVYGKMYNCSREILIISTFIEICKANMGDMYAQPKHKGDNYNKFMTKIKKLGHKYGDHLSLLNIYDMFKSYSDKQQQQQKWVHDNFLKMGVLIKVARGYQNSKRLTHKIEKEKVLNIGLKYYDNIMDMELEDRVLYCIVSGLRLNSGVSKTKTPYYKVSRSTLDKIGLHKFSFFVLKKIKPMNIVYHELFISGQKSELSIVSEIPKHIIKLLS